MAKKVILKLADAQDYIDVSDNFTTERFERFATRAQETPLRELLGDAIYYLLYNDLNEDGVPQTEPYIKLVNGETYDYDGDTVQYFGLKPFLSFNWGAVNTREGDNFASDYGNIYFDDNPQDNMRKLSQGSLDRLNSSYMKEVTSYRNNIVQYLNDNETDFPTWDGRIENKPKSQFNSFTI